MQLLIATSVSDGCAGSDAVGRTSEGADGGVGEGNPAGIRLVSGQLHELSKPENTSIKRRSFTLGVLVRIIGLYRLLQ